MRAETFGIEGVGLGMLVEAIVFFLTSTLIYKNEACQKRLRSARSINPVRIY
jgi:hypothetical protein